MYKIRVFVVNGTMENDNKMVKIKSHTKDNMTCWCVNYFTTNTTLIYHLGYIVMSVSFSHGLASSQDRIGLHNSKLFWVPCATIVQGGTFFSFHTLTNNWWMNMYISIVKYIPYNLSLTCWLMQARRARRQLRPHLASQLTRKLKRCKTVCVWVSRELYGTCLEQGKSP